MLQNKTYSNTMRLFVLLILLVPNLVYAYPSGQYFGFGSGYTWTQARFNDKVRTLGLIREVPSYSDVSNSGLPWYAFMGFQFHPNYGIEMGYLDYGTIQFTKTLTKYDDSNNTLTGKSVRDADISSRGFYLQHVLSYSMLDSLILQARAGVLLGNTHYSEIETLTTISEDTGSLEVVQPNVSDKGFLKAQFALSALYKANRNWHWRLQLNQIDIQHSEEKEEFSHWFTSIALEYQLQD